jgi:hypothetical protein
MGDDATDWIEADTQVSDAKYRFLFRLNEEGGKVAYNNDLPVPAMLACAAAECAWGTSPIFQATGCRFNLQKPATYTWMDCKRIKRKTDGLGNGTLVTVDFCVADDWADSVRLWCVWILNYPNVKLRNEVLSYRKSPRDFCLRLPKVGFGPQSSAAWAATAKGYTDVFDQFQLNSFIWTE